MSFVSINYLVKLSGTTWTNVSVVFLDFIRNLQR